MLDFRRNTWVRRETCVGSARTGIEVFGKESHIDPLCRVTTCIPGGPALYCVSPAFYCLIRVVPTTSDGAVAAQDTYF
jgi:hypothetical protein